MNKLEGIPRYSEGIETNICVDDLYQTRRFKEGIPRYSEGIETLWSCPTARSRTNKKEYPVIQRGLRLGVGQITIVCSGMGRRNTPLFRGDWDYPWYFSFLVCFRVSKEYPVIQRGLRPQVLQASLQVRFWSLEGIPRYSEGIETLWSCPTARSRTNKKEYPVIQRGLRLHPIIIHIGRLAVVEGIPRYSEGIETFLLLRIICNLNNWMKEYPVIQRGLRLTNIIPLNCSKYSWRNTPLFRGDWDFRIFLICFASSIKKEYPVIQRGFPD